MNGRTSFNLAILLAFAQLAMQSRADEVGTVGGRLETRWASNVSLTLPHPEYPRPGLVRAEWENLNGKWDYTITTFAGPSRAARSGSILVPFPVESSLSGVGDAFNSQKKLEYRRKFTIPSAWNGKRILLHFDAVNWEARVELNDKLLGTHRGGYERFSYDITDVLTNGDQNLTVTVVNPGDKGRQPRGKQTFSPHGIWYTSASGIWQTVWLEPVPEVFVAGVKLVPDIDTGSVEIVPEVHGKTNGTSVEAVGFDEGRVVGRATGQVGQPLRIKIADAKLWLPENPFLYDLKISLAKNGSKIDEVATYFGMRKVRVAKGVGGFPRIQLNNSDYFQLGVLDQGYWPDGIYTAPTDDALRSDIDLMKRLGFNMCRKHVKVEPERWYYWCDKLGLLVWQDMPSPGRFASPTAKDAAWPAGASEAFRQELAGVLKQNQNHPSIALWIAFNEGWGQHDTPAIVNFIQEIDPQRLVVSASGWNDRGVGDVLSLHRYPGPALPNAWDKRAIVCGECGGLGLPIAGHLWDPRQAWSYSKFHTAEELNAAYADLVERIVVGKEAGLSGAVITQLTDVESEVNGLATYDREVVKLNPAPINMKLVKETQNSQ